MSRLTIIEGNTNEKDNVRTFFGKAEKGDDGVSPEASVTKSNGIATITIKDANGTTNASIEDGFDPVVETSKTDGVATISITDAEGTHSFELNDGETYEIPTNGVIGWGSNDTIPNGYEEIMETNAYSTDEMKIGTWTDGKPLYRKVFQTTLPDSSSKSITTNFGNQIIVRRLYGTACDTANKPYAKPIPFIDAFDNKHIGLFMGAGDGKIYIKALGDNNNEQTYIYVEYTKTTD